MRNSQPKQFRRLHVDYKFILVGLLGCQLSQRELVVLQMMRSNLTLSEIAGELFLSLNTVKTHARNIYRKTGARNRTDAVQLAFSRTLRRGEGAPRANVA